MISRMRSSPANASLICVPIDAIWTSGAAIKPTKKMYMMKSPSVIVCARMARPPTMIMRTPMSPTITAEPEPTADVPVIVLATLRKSLCTPRAKTSRSRRSATYTFTSRTPPRLSASRPVTSALMTLRSRNSGRRRLNAIAIIPAKEPRTMIMSAVSFQFSQNRMPRASRAVMTLPTS